MYNKPYNCNIWSSLRSARDMPIYLYCYEMVLAVWTDSSVTVDLDVLVLLPCLVLDSLVYDLVISVLGYTLVLGGLINWDKITSLFALQLWLLPLRFSCLFMDLLLNVIWLYSLDLMFRNYCCWLLHFYLLLLLVCLSDFDCFMNITSVCCYYYYYHHYYHFIFFHQFEQDVLEACLFLLERGRVAMTEWRDPVIVSRMVSALVSHIHMTSTYIHRKSSIWPWFWEGEFQWDRMW